MEENKNVTNKKGGLYKNVKMSVKTADKLVIAGIILFFIVFFILVSNPGFVVKFDTDGGSHIDSVKVMHGEIIPEFESPVKEGYNFKGWYEDKALMYEFDVKKDKVESSMTLYAKWEKKK